MNTSAQPYKELLLIKKKEGRAVAFGKALTVLVAVNLLLIRVTNLARTAMNFVEGVFGYLCLPFRRRARSCITHIVHGVLLVWIDVLVQ